MGFEIASLLWRSNEGVDLVENVFACLFTAY